MSTTDVCGVSEKFGDTYIRLNDQKVLTWLGKKVV